MTYSLYFNFRYVSGQSYLIIYSFQVLLTLGGNKCFYRMQYQRFAIE